MKAFRGHWRIALCAILVSGAVSAGENYNVGEFVIGQSAGGDIRIVSMKLDVQTRGNSQISFLARGIDDRARMNIQYSQRNANELVTIFSKALKWAEVALKNGIEHEKTIGCFSIVGPGCDGLAVITSSNSLRFVFESKNAGKSSQLVMYITDVRDKSLREILYFDLAGITQLLTNTEQLIELYANGMEALEQQEIESQKVEALFQ